MSLRNSRVALVVGTTTGGTGTHVKALVRRLVELDATVTVLGPQATNRLFGFESDGASFVPVEISSSPHAADARTVMQLRPYLRSADIVHAHGLRAGFLASLAVGRHRLPFVVTLHNAVLASGLRSRLFAVIERIVVRRATVVLCVSSDLVRRAVSFGARDVRLAPVGSGRLPRAMGTKESVRAELDIPQGRPLILAVARLAHQKGLDVLLAAAPTWQARPDRPVLVIAGDGPAEDQLRAQATELGLDTRFLGRRSDVPDLLAAADVVVLASRWEGSPLSAHEALQAGRPLVATEVGGVPDLVATPVGPAAVLVPSEDAAALGDAVGRVLDEPELAKQLIARGLARADEWPDAGRTVDSVIALYQDLSGAAV